MLSRMIELYILLIYLLRHLEMDVSVLLFSYLLLNPFPSILDSFLSLFSFLVFPVLLFDPRSCFGGWLIRDTRGWWILRSSPWPEHMSWSSLTRTGDLWTPPLVLLCIQVPYQLPLQWEWSPDWDCRIFPSRAVFSFPHWFPRRTSATDAARDR